MSGQLTQASTNPEALKVTTGQTLQLRIVLKSVDVLIFSKDISSVCLGF